MNSILAKAAAKKNKWISKEQYDDSDSDSQDSISSDDEFDVSRDVIFSVYSNRYIPIKYLGRGTFSRVWLSYDIMENRLCGIKIIFKKYSEDATDEIKRNNVISSKLDFTKENIGLSKMLDNFTLKSGETAIVYELLGVSMIDIQDYYENMVPLHIVKKIMKDVLFGLQSLHSVKLIHTDLKPENILTNIYKRGILFYKDIFENKHNFKEIFDKLIEETLPETYSSMDKSKKNT